MTIPCLFIPKTKNILFIALGGGGDIALTSVLALSYEKCGGKSFIGGIVWERYVVDIIPGPIKLEEFHNIVETSNDYIAVNAHSYAIRGNRIIHPQIVNASKILNRNLYVFDIYGGPQKLAKSMEDFIRRYNIDLVIGVDVGGDSLAKGYEENLWSPLADAIGVASLAQISKPSYLALASPGADGELDHKYLYSRVQDIARLGGYIGGYILSIDDINILKEILKYVNTEASSIPLLLFREKNENEISIRLGSRRVEIGFHNLMILLFDSQIVARDSIARYIYGTKDLFEAREILNELGIYTELDLEEDIYREFLQGKSIETIDVVELRRKGIKRLMKKHFIRTLMKVSSNIDNDKNFDDYNNQ